MQEDFLVLIEVLNKSIVITIFVFVMMMLIDYLNVLTKGRMEHVIKGGRFRQYVISSFLGSTPGCLGSFMNVSFYVHGLITFGAIAGGMIATSGDEAFVMLVMFPREALILFGILFVLGIVSAWIIDLIAKKIKLVRRERCKLQVLHEEEIPFRTSIRGSFSLSRCILFSFFLAIIISNLLGVWGPQEIDIKRPERILLLSLSGITLLLILISSEHYFREHIVDHLLKRHVWKVFLWTFFSLLFVEIALPYWNLEEVVRANMDKVLFLSALIGIIPESGPHMIFVFMFAKDIIPFSVLLTSSIVQDGHGMLPLFSYSVRDSLIIKLFNLIIGIAIGEILFHMGF